MVRAFPLFLLVLLLGISCREQDDRGGDVEREPKVDIKGDWEFGNDQGFERLISFDGPYYWFVSITREPHKWTYASDTLVLHQLLIHRGVSRVDMAFKLVPLGTDSLVLYPVGPFAREFLDHWGGGADSLCLVRMTQRNRIEPISIKFESTPCLGECSSMAVEVDSVGRLSFFGASHTWLIGEYFGLVEAAAFERLKERLNAIDSASFGVFHHQQVTDGPVLCVAVETNRRSFCSCVYGQAGPAELWCFLQDLQTIYQHAQLELLSPERADIDLWASSTDFCGLNDLPVRNERLQ